MYGRQGFPTMKAVSRPPRETPAFVRFPDTLFCNPGMLDGGQMFCFCSYMKNGGIWARFQIDSLSDTEREALRRALTLGHLRDGDKLVAVCSGCLFGKIIDPRRLRRRLAAHLRNAPLATLEKRLQCSKCKTRGASRFFYAAAED
jgi:hypothetical protein